MAAILVPIGAAGVDLNNPTALALDHSGNLFVADGHSIYKYAPDSTKSTFAEGLKYPLGLSLDGKGNLFVSDGAATDAKSSILKFTPDGKRSTFATGISSVGMAFDRSGNLFVSQGDSIFKFTPEGKKSTFTSGIVPETYDPYHVAEVFTGLAPDRSGNLFVAEHVTGSIFKFTPDGKKSTFATGMPVGATGQGPLAEKRPRTPHLAFPADT